jgi:DNA polymerase-1
MPNFIFFDTETNGLHIMTSLPFSYQIAHLKDTPIYLDVTPAITKKIIAELSKPNTWLIGHNIKYDCHMLINAGIPITLFKDLHIIDTMFMARLAINHDDQIGNPRFKKPPMNLALKKLAEKYLGVGSRDEELQVKEEFKKLNTKHKLEFKLFLTDLLTKPPTTEQLNKYYSVTEANLIASDYIYDPVIITARNDWFEKNPRPTYRDIPEYILKPYATKDIILTRGIFLKFYDAIKSKNQLDVFIRESKAMYPLLLMEREGLVIDKETARMKYKELYEMRKILNIIYAPVTLIKSGSKPLATYFELTTPSHKDGTIVEDKVTGLYLEYHKKDILVFEGERVNTKSSPQMTALYQYETGEVITKADKATREEILDKSPSAKKIQLLRPLDKIIDTYLYRLVNDLILVDGEWRLYGTYNNLDDSYNEDDDTAGTVTGRLSSDLQQFPKEPLKANDGTEIVNIRKLFIKPRDAYAMVYFDMNQLELKLQTIWSAIIDGTPDIVMARGFGPYQCHEAFDKDGNSMGWFLNEDPMIQWKPTDFHIATAKEAFGDLPDYEAEKVHYRTLGKRANFAIGYGASKWKLMESLKVTQARAEKLISGWKKAYVGLTHMESYLRGATRVAEYQTNLFGRRYYTRDVHKLKNWLVQGSGGDLLKIFLARCIPFINKYPHWKLMLTVHDEIDFVVTKEPTKEEVKELLALMYYEAGGIEVTADAEITFTSWSEQTNFVV